MANDMRYQEPDSDLAEREHLAEWVKKSYDELSSLHSKWASARDLVANTGAMSRRYNPASDFVGQLQVRLFRNDFRLTLLPDNPVDHEEVSKHETIGRSILRTSGLQAAMGDAIAWGMASNILWLEVGHPLDRNLVSYTRRKDIQDRTVMEPVDIQESEYEPVDDDELMMAGVDIASIEPMDPTMAPPPMREKEATPLFVQDSGVPYVEEVDPRLMVYPPSIDSMKKAGFIAKLHFFSAGELVEVFPDFKFPKEMKDNIPESKLKDLYEATSGEKLCAEDGVICIVEMYVIRCRRYPSANGKRFIFAYGDPETTIEYRRNPHAGMIPYVPVQPLPLKRPGAKSKIAELQPMCDGIDLMLQGVEEYALEASGAKWVIQNNSGLSDTDESNLTNPAFKGKIKVNDINAFRRLVAEFNENLPRLINLFRGIAQSTVGTSDMETGQAIKDITAQQVQFLAEATGAAMAAMRKRLDEGATQVFLRLMYLAGRFSQLTDARKYHGSSKGFVEIAMGAHNFLSSGKYEVSLSPEEQRTNDDKILITNLLKTLLMDPTLEMYHRLDLMKLLSVLLRSFGYDPDELLSELPWGSNAMMPGVQPTGMPGAPVAPGGAVARDQVLQGEHPERLTGSQGLSGTMANAISGLRR